MKTNILIIILAIAVTSCRSTKETSETVITHKIENSEVIHTRTTVQLPVTNYTIIDRPCPNDTIRNINQVLTAGKTTVTVKTIEGKIAIKIEKEIDSSTVVEKSVEMKDVKETLIDKEKVITRYPVPKWLWHILKVLFVVSIGLNIWAYRKPVIAFFRKLIIGI